MILAAAPAWEKVGEKVFSTFSGIVLIEASKQLYAGNIQPAPAQQRAYATVTPGNSSSSQRSR